MGTMEYCEMGKQETFILTMWDVKLVCPSWRSILSNFILTMWDVKNHLEYKC